MLPRQEYPGLLIAAARRRIKQAVLARAERHGLSNQQFWTMIALHEHPGLSQAELVSRLWMDAPTASRVLAALVRRKLARSTVDPEDRRRTRLTLSPAGAALAPALVRSAREVREAVTHGMAPAEVEALRRGLKRVIANLERLDAQAAAEGNAP